VVAGVLGVFGAWSVLLDHLIHFLGPAAAALVGHLALKVFEHFDILPVAGHGDGREDTQTATIGASFVLEVLGSRQVDLDFFLAVGAGAAADLRTGGRARRWHAAKEGKPD